MSTRTRFATAGLILLAYILFLWADSASAQAAAYISHDTIAAPDEGLTTIRKQVNEVNLFFSATDRRGRFIDNLSESQIDLRDKGLAPAAIHRFAVQTDQPLRIVLLIDASDSVNARFTFEKNAAADFLRVAMRPAIDQAMIVAFNQTIRRYQGWTSDVNALRASLQMIQQGGGTALYDALVSAAQSLTQQDASLRRIVVVMTDGQDNASHASLDTAIERLLRAEGPVYVVNTSTLATYSDRDELFVTAARSMKKIASDTGGRFLSGDSSRELRAAFARINTEFHNQYLIAYTPAALLDDGRFRKIDIRVRNHHGVLIHARRGYYSNRPVNTESHP